MEIEECGCVCQVLGIALRMQRPGKLFTTEHRVVTTWCRQSKSEYDPLALTLLA